MRDCISSPDAVSAWLRGLGREREVYFPLPAGAASYSFRKVSSESEVRLDRYRPSIIPPGRRLFPDGEPLFSFARTADGGYSFAPARAEGRQVLAGVRPCDLKAIGQMDAVFSEGFADPLYLGRRAGTAIVAVSCLEPCDERCFCAAMGSLGQREGADVFITPLDGRLLMETLTEAGRELLAGLAAEPCEEAAALREAAETQRPRPFGRELAAPPAALPEILRKQYRSPVYGRYAERCFSCGTCNLVCPTCYCFDVRCRLDLDLAGGTHFRTWDGCMIPGFAEVAGGHNFRPGAADRQRHRLERKLEYLPGRFGLGSFCVGCGRCGRQCTTGIDIFDLVRDLVAAAGESP